MAPRTRLARFLVAASALAFAVPSALAATVYNVSIGYGQYGHLDQANVSAADGPSGANSCVPTAVVNSFVFLENRYASVYGTSLTGGAPEAAAETLATATYMNTSSVNGTSGTNWIDGKYKYMEAQIAGVTAYGAQVSTGFYGGTKTFVQNNTDPTWQFLYDAIRNFKDIELGIIGAGIGHAITLSSFSWTDQNDDGVIQQAENATLDFIDPGDPSATRFMDIWQSAAGGILKIDSGAYNGYSVVLAISETAVPLPAAAWAGLGLLGGIAVLRRRRRVAPEFESFSSN